MAKKKPKKTSKKATQPKAVRTITTADRAHIVNLADLIYSFLPIRVQSTRVETLTTIFRESNIQKYLAAKDYSRQAIEKAVIKLFRYHERLPKTIFRKLVPAAIKYRNFRKNPLRREELDQLDKVLQQLGVDLNKEFKATILEPPALKKVLPSTDLIRKLETHPLCPQLRSEPIQLFKNGHYNESVRKATEKFETEIQNRTGSTDHGKNLMHKTFHVKNPAIALNGLATANEKSIQEGYQQLTAGMMQAMRNIFSHGDEDQISSEEAFEMLMFVNWLFRQLPVQE